MSDFDFNSADAPVEDPAAEFLAREQSALGDIDDDFTFNNGTSDQVLTATVNGDFSNGDFANQPNGDVNDLANGVSDITMNGKQESSSSNQPPITIMPTEEPESIKKWREAHKKALEEKDENEKTKIAELKEQGKQELEEWYTRYADQLQKSKQQNRNAEKEWVAERDNEASGQDWEKITKLCDFNPKTSRNTKDTSRMRSILLQVKQTPPLSSAQKVSS
ncbi:hypothetical protein RDWZM_004198 [Blomia tropicalis]|uniref:Clathrin light chain n=1 Tax=Blomia tropicalis TaxID=40697 RepID=A0A9Q0RRK5_BLOTA|nr:hypothetical protein RDWZM_004198 [Blomia tropicalis]